VEFKDQETRDQVIGALKRAASEPGV
jgi:hypothetical protein